MALNVWAEALDVPGKICTDARLRGKDQPSLNYPGGETYGQAGWTVGFRFRGLSQLSVKGSEPLICAILEEGFPKDQVAMPRKPRFFIADIPTHVVQRGNNRQAIFFAENDYRVYLGWIAEAAKRWSCAVHAYVLMTNHVHLLLTPQDREGVSRLVQYVGRRYVPYVNHEYGRTGTLWEGRFKSSLVQERSYLLACYRYIELNPVRAGMVEAPADYAWSSYRSNALGEEDPILSAHADYLALGHSDSERRSAYQALFGTHLDRNIVAQVRECLQTGTPLGNDRFRAQIEQALGRPVGYSRRGRPKKPIEEDGTENRGVAKQLPLKGAGGI